MLDKPIKELIEADLQGLVELGIGEGHRLDFKLQVPDDQDLRADVTALANSAGGDLLIGVDEKQSVATDVPGVECDPDADIVGLEQILRARILPRIPDLQVRAVPLQSGRHVIVIRVGRSWAAPHGVQSRSGTSWRFVGRGSLGLYDLDFEQMRAAFLGAADMPVRLRELHRREVNKALAGDVFANLDLDRPLVVMTLTPLTTAAGTPQAIVLDRQGRGLVTCAPLGPCGGYGPRWNADGIGLVGGGQGVGDPDLGLVQFYRDGRVTFFDTNSITTRGGGIALASKAWPKYVREAIRRTLYWMHESRVAPPVVTQITLVGVANCTLGLPNSSALDDPKTIGRDVIELPAVQFDDLAVPDDDAAGLGPIFDTLWQAFGLPEAPRGDILFGRG